MYTITVLNIHLIIHYKTLTKHFIIIWTPTSTFFYIKCHVEPPHHKNFPGDIIG